MLVLEVTERISRKNNTDYLLGILIYLKWHIWNATKAKYVKNKKTLFAWCI